MATSGLSPQRRKFCELIAQGNITQTDAYLQAYPKSARKSAKDNAARLIAIDSIKLQIQRLRDEAAEKPGYCVLTIAEKRDFLARVVRAKVRTEPSESDLWQSVKETKDGTEYRLPDKLAAIKADNDLAGDGSEAGGNDALSELLKRI